jgi:hypothetical protein
MLSLAAGSARAGDWNVQENADAAVGYVSNPRLIPDAAVTDEEAIAALSAALRHETETSLLLISPRVATTRYRTLKELDNTGGALAVNWQESGLRSSWFVDATGEVASTLTTELGLSGLNDVNRQRQSASTNAGTTLNWSELSQLGIQVSGTRVHYRDAEGTGLSDYNYVSAMLNPSWSVGSLSRITLSTEADSLSSDNVDKPQRNYALDLGFSRQQSEHNNWHVRLGASGVDIGSTLKLGWILNAGWSHQWEKGSFTASIRRQISPVGNGLLARSDTLSLAGARSFTEHSGLSLTVDFTRSAAIDTSFDNTTFVLYRGSLWGNVTGQWRWQFRPEWATALRASYSSSEDGLSGPWAHGWEARWSVAWQAAQK